MIRFSNDVFSVQHPLVDALIDRKITEEAFVAGLKPSDPFIVKKAGKDTQVHGFYDKQVEMNASGIRRQNVTSMRKQFGINLEKFVEAKTQVLSVFPELADNFKALDVKITEGCQGCQRNKIVADIIVKMSTLPKRDVSALSSLIPELGRKILAGERVEDADILAALPDSIYDKMDKLPKRDRPVFFTSERCSGGKDPDICRRCRTDREFRKKLNRDYEIPMFATASQDDLNITFQVAEQPALIEDFDCPFAETMSKKYPSVFTQVTNGFKALGRVVGATLKGKSIRVPQPVAALRSKICSECDSFDDQQQRCTECGCFIAAKKMLTTEVCPLGKWPPVNVGQQPPAYTPPASSTTSATAPAPGELPKPLEFPADAFSIPKRKGDVLDRICIIGHPSRLGGADTELDHQIRVWQALGIEVYILHTGDIDKNLASMNMKERGVKYLPNKDWKSCKDMVVISYCNDKFLSNIEEIRSYAKKTLWVNCMTWLFPAEIEAHRKGLLDVFIYQTDHARMKMQDTLREVNKNYTWAKVRPYFHADDFPFHSTRPADKFRFGRISRDDPAKFYGRTQWIYATMCAPVLKEGIMLGVSDKIVKKIGESPAWIKNVAPGGMSSQDLYKHAEVIIQACDTYENLPRVAFEAMSSGSLLIVDDRGGWKEQIQHRETGYLCADEREFVYYATRAAYEPKERKQMILNARDHLLQNWGMEQAKQEWANLLGSLG